MRCLEALGEWEQLESNTREFIQPLMDADDCAPIANQPISDEQKESAKLATVAAWQLENWETYEKMMDFIPIDDFDGAFFRG